MPFIELVAQRRAPTPPAGMKPPENATDWFRMEATPGEDDSTDIYIYESIGGWFGMYADEFIYQLQQVSSSKVNLRLNSPGGSVFEGIAIANAIRSHPATVTVYVDSLAASIASVIALAGDRVVMMPQSQFMVHNASGACYGDATEMTKMADLLDKQSLNIAKAYAEHTGGSLADWQAYMDAETWFTAEEAVAAGLADEAMPMKPKQDDDEPASAPASAMANMSRTWDLSMYNYAGRGKAPAPVIKSLAAADAAASALKVDIASPEFQNYVREAIRNEIRAQLAVVEGTACPSHTTAVKDGTWDAGANEGRLPSPVPLATVRAMYAYYDETKVEDGAVPKSACKLPHHFVSADGSPGAASVSGVRNALARLPQTQGLTDAERTAAKAHLQKHLDAFDSDEEDHVHDDHGDPAIDDASKPPFPPPDEDEDEPDDAATPDEEPDDAAPAPDEDEPDDAADADAADAVDPNEPADDATEWSALVAGLTQPPSSADDVFNSLKEAW